MPSQSIVPFSEDEIVQEFGELAGNLSSIERAQQNYPDDFNQANGSTDEERYLWLYTGRIKALATTIETFRLEIGFFIYVGNQKGIYLPSGESCMEDYLESQRGVSRELINQSKNSYSVWVKVRGRGVPKERIQSASYVQIEAIKDLASDVESQKKKIKEELARQAGSKSFNELPKEKKTDVAREVEKMCGEEIRKGTESILDLPSEEVHRISTSTGKRTDKPLIIISGIYFDASIGQLSFKGGSVLLSEEHVTAIKRGHITYKFKVEGQSELLSEQELGEWLAEAF